MRWLDRLRSKEPEAKQEELVIVENVAGNFSYHLAEPSGENTNGLKPLCGYEKLPMMGTSQPLYNWGYRGHLNERYCAECEDLAHKRGVALGEAAAPPHPVPRRARPR